MSQAIPQAPITQYDVVKIVGNSTEDAKSHQGLTGTAVDVMADGSVYFEGDEKTIFALIRALEVIGEAIKQLPSALTSQYPEIPWRGFAGMRDRLTHAYFGVKLDILWNTTQEDLPLLKPVIQAMVEQSQNVDSD